MTGPQTAVGVVMVELPIPDTGIGPNGRLGWRAKAKLVAEYRGWAQMATLAAMQAGQIEPGTWDRARLSLVWCYCGTKPDADNAVARIKPGCDGAMDAGLLRDDVAIELGAVAFVRVRHKADQQVQLWFHRTDSERQDA